MIVFFFDRDHVIVDRELQGLSNFEFIKIPSKTSYIRFRENQFLLTLKGAQNKCAQIERSSVKSVNECVCI